MAEFTDPCAYGGVYTGREVARLTALPGVTSTAAECPACHRLVAVIGVGDDARYSDHARMLDPDTVGALAALVRRCPTCEDRWTTGTECSRCSDGIVWAAEGHWLQRAVGAASSALTGFAAAFGWTAPEPF